MGFQKDWYRTMALALREAFRRFCESNEIIHTKSAPYHPPSNGPAKQAEQTLKNRLRKLETGSLNGKLQKKFCIPQYPHATTGSKPAVLRRRPPIRVDLNRLDLNRLDLIRPDDSETVRRKQKVQKENHDTRCQALKCNGRKGLCPELWNETSLDFSQGDKRTGPVSYQCKLEDGRIIQRHIDHLRLGQHTSDQVIKKVRTSTPKKDRLEGRGD